MSSLADLLMEKRKKYEKKAEKINKKLESINNQLDQIEHQIKPNNKSILKGVSALARLAYDLDIPEDIKQQLLHSRDSTIPDPFIHYRINTPLMIEIRDKYLIHYAKKTSVCSNSYRPEMEGTFSFYFTDGWVVIIYMHVEKYHEEWDGTITLKNTEKDINICLNCYEYPDEFDNIMQELEKKYGDLQQYKNIFGLFRNDDMYFDFLSNYCYM